jgi:hypothetical protein
MEFKVIQTKMEFKVIQTKMEFKVIQTKTEFKVIQTLPGDSARLLDDKTLLIGNTQKQEAFVYSQKKGTTWEVESSFPATRMLFLEFEAIGVWCGDTAKIIRWDRTEKSFELLYFGDLDIYAKMLSPHLLIQSSRDMEAPILDLRTMKEMCTLKFKHYKDYISLGNPKEQRRFTNTLVSLLPLGAIPKDIAGIVVGFL